MYNKKPLREAIKNLDRAAAPAKKKDMIVDPMGQWKYPGQNTKIPSNDITMQGVPYPVWAVPNVGAPQMMYPEQDYYFPGANHVDEYPQVAQRGGDISIPQLNQYEDGGEYDLTDEEIAELKAGGYIVEDVDTNEYEKGGFQDDLGKHRKLLRDWTYGASIGMLHKAQIGKNFRRTYDPLLDYKPQVAESTIPKNLPKVDKAILDKAIAQKTTERKAVAKEIKKSPLLTPKQKTEILMSPQKLDENVHLAYQKAPDTVKESTPQSTTGRVWDIVTNPQAAFEYAIRTGDVSNMPHNYNAMRMAGIDPSAGGGSNLVGDVLNMTTNLFDAGDKVVRNIGEGNYGTAALEALRFLPGARVSTGLGKQTSKYLTTQTPLRNTYKINPLAVKENPEMFLYRARPINQNLDMNMAAQLRAKEAAGEPLTWYQRNLLNPQTNPQILAREKYYGQWFEKDPSRLDFYINPGTRNFADNDAIEILRTRLPKEEAAKLNVSQFEDAKILSASPETEFILSKDMINSAERFPESSLQQLIQEDKLFNTPHWLRGYKEVPVELSGSPNTFTRSGFLNPKFVSATNPVKQVFSDIKGSFETAGKDIKHYINNYSNIKKVPGIYKDEIAKLLTPEGKQRLIDLGVDDIDDFMNYLDRAIVSTRRNLPTSALEFNRKGKLTPTVNFNFDQLNKAFGTKKLSEDRLKWIAAHELGHNIQGYLESIGKTFKGNSELDVQAVNELLPFVNKETKSFLDKSRGITEAEKNSLLESIAEPNFTPIANAEYLLRGQSGLGREAFPHLRELKQQMLQKGVIKNIHDNITAADIQKFYSDFGGNKSRILSFIEKDGYNTLAKLLNKTPLLISGTLLTGAMQEENGGYIETKLTQKEIDEYRKGGYVIDELD